MPSESSATTTTASVLAPRLMANEPAIGQRSTRTERARGFTRNTLGLLPPRTRSYPPPCGEGRREAPGWGSCGDPLTDPHPQPLPTRGRGAHRAYDANVLQGQT